jgi:hypothetical protein
LGLEHYGGAKFPGSFNSGSDGVDDNRLGKPQTIAGQ